MRWYKVRDKEPEEVNIAIYNGGCYAFVRYLPPRRGDEYGDWQFSDGNTRPALPNEDYVEIDDLFSADSINGKVEFICREINKTKN